MREISPTVQTEPRGDLILSRRVKARANGLWLPVDLSLEAWCQIGVQITMISESSAWWIGDWLIYGRKKFPDRYKQAIEETSLDYQTLRNYAWVSKRFAVPRRRGRLSFQHHAEVAALPIDLQDAWLDKADAAHWPVHELRRQRKAGGAGQRMPGPSASTVKLVVTASQKRSWQAAASAKGINLDTWIVLALDTAAASADTSG